MKDKYRRGQSFRSQFNSTINDDPNRKDISNKEIYEHLRRNFKNMKGITPMRFWNYIWQKSLSYLTCCCRKQDAKTRRHEKFVAKSKSALAKEMDLRKFILRQRISAMSAMTTLSGRQS